jgi:hypothetical protein
LILRAERAAKSNENRRIKEGNRMGIEEPR